MGAGGWKSANLGIILNHHVHKRPSLTHLLVLVICSRKLNSTHITRSYEQVCRQVLSRLIAISVQMQFSRPLRIAQLVFIITVVVK